MSRSGNPLFPRNEGPAYPIAPKVQNKPFQETPHWESRVDVDRLELKDPRLAARALDSAMDPWI